MKKALMAGAALSLMMTGSAWADITIAVAGPMTGQYASFGEQMKAGAEQAIADIVAAVDMAQKVDFDTLKRSSKHA